MTITLKQLLISFCVLMLIVSCKQKPAGDTPVDTGDQPKLDSLVTIGKRFQSNHLDSLMLVARQLNDISKSGSKRALVYAELLNAQYYWLKSDHERSMEIAVQCLADAEKWNIKSIIPEIYIIIGNLHKETSNYKMAFDAAEKGLASSIANKDTSEIIALLSLKAMFTHSFWLFNHDKTKPDSAIKLQFAALKMAESSPKYERLRTRFYDNISQNYLDEKDYKNSIAYAEKGVAIALKYNQQRSLTYSYCWLGQAWYFEGERAKGLDYIYKALHIAQTLKQPYRIMELYGNLNHC